MIVFHCFKETNRCVSFGAKHYILVSSVGNQSAGKRRDRGGRRSYALQCRRIGYFVAITIKYN